VTAAPEQVTGQQKAKRGLVLCVILFSLQYYYGALPLKTLQCCGLLYAEAMHVRVPARGATGFSAYIGCALMVMAGSD
jgi:hypothetical protein